MTNTIPASIPRIECVEVRGARFYRVEGYEQLFPSVTTVLGVLDKPALRQWYANVALDNFVAALEMLIRDGDPLRANNLIYINQIPELRDRAAKHPKTVVDEAADYGTQAHIYISRLLALETVEYEPQFDSVMAGFDKWREETGWHISLQERMVFHSMQGYAGTFDALGSKDGRLAIFDWKTSNAIWSPMAMQVAAYAKAYSWMYKVPVDEAWIIRLPKVAPQEGEVAFEARQVTNIDLEYNLFLHALALYRERNHKPWKEHPDA